jgi:hypothetical protein
MIQPINIPINQFELLLNKPYSWKVLVQKSWGLIKGDQIKYIEVNSVELPTGRELIGLIDCVSNGDELINEGVNTWAFCLNVSRGLSNAVLGESLVIV